MSGLAGVVDPALAQLLAALAAVTGVVNVTDGLPQARDWNSWLAGFRRPDASVQGWIVEAEVREERDEAPSTDHVTLSWRLTGFRSVDLARGSRAAFRDVVVAVMDALRGSTLAGTVEFVDPVASRLDGNALVEDRPLGEVLCHVAELGVTAHAWVAA